ncbi:MAG TPA: phosphodiesterase [Burkholderiales bacterium]|jgi:3',5'-cyclic AMP phosphodiesterase CpdA|nr:phosphodiesterase [Burkholderiales bacterium]
MLIAQITDLHVGAAGFLAYGRYDTSNTLSRCIAHLLRQRPAPDVVLATGDLVDAGLEEEYRRLQALLAPIRMPLYLIPGNHDDRDALRRVFRDHTYLGPVGEPARYSIEGYALRLIALDTTVPGETGGALDDAQIEWLDAQLAAAPREPALVFMHHPPFKTGIARMDTIGLAAASAERLGAVLSRHSHVQLLTCGHVHRAIQVRWHGTIASVCPSTAFQYGLNLEDSKLEPSPHEPPAYQLHCWNRSGLVTHTVAVDLTT